VTLSRDSSALGASEWRIPGRKNATHRLQLPDPVQGRVRPIRDDAVHIYVCGPTVYDHAHIGHAKAYITFDTIVRYLRYLGYRVRYVQNLTDVGHLLDTGEDRIAKGARRERVEPMELVETYIRSYFEDMDALNIGRPNISPRPTCHISEQIELTQALLAKGTPTRRTGVSTSTSRPGRSMASFQDGAWRSRRKARGSTCLTRSATRPTLRSGRQPSRGISCAGRARGGPATPAGMSSAR